MATKQRVVPRSMWLGLLLTLSLANVIDGFGAFGQKTQLKLTPIIRLSGSAIGSTTTTSVDVWSEERVKTFAENEGLNITLTTLGPGWRAIVRSLQNSSDVLGYCEGFLRPGGSIVHMDKIEIFRKQVLKLKSESKTFTGAAGSLFGPSLLLGFLILLYAKEKGYTIAEFLAIDDEDRQHKKLVKYYKRIGFKVIKYVGDGVMDVPDRMMWGGRGTLMREDIDFLLARWTTMLSKSEQAKTNA